MCVYCEYNISFTQYLAWIRCIRCLSRSRGRFIFHCVYVSSINMWIERKIIAKHIYLILISRKSIIKVNKLHFNSYRFISIIHSYEGANTHLVSHLYCRAMGEIRKGGVSSNTLRFQNKTESKYPSLMCQH